MCAHACMRVPPPTRRRVLSLSTVVSLRGAGGAGGLKLDRAPGMSSLPPSERRRACCSANRTDWRSILPAVVWTAVRFASHGDLSTFTRSGRFEPGNGNIVKQFPYGSVCSQAACHAFDEKRATQTLDQSTQALEATDKPSWHMLRSLRFKSWAPLPPQSAWWPGTGVLAKGRVTGARKGRGAGRGWEKLVMVDVGIVTLPSVRQAGAEVVDAVLDWVPIELCVGWVAH
jgi:hypothetical protein